MMRQVRVVLHTCISERVPNFLSQTWPTFSYHTISNADNLLAALRCGFRKTNINPPLCSGHLTTCLYSAITDLTSKAR